MQKLFKVHVNNKGLERIFYSKGFEFVDVGMGISLFEYIFPNGSYVWVSKLERFGEDPTDFECIEHPESFDDEIYVGFYNDGDQLYECAIFPTLFEFLHDW